MTDLATLQSLKSRIQSGSGADRELDALVWIATGPPADPAKGLCGYELAEGWHYEYGPADWPAGEVAEYVVNAKEGKRQRQAVRKAPAYTSYPDGVGTCLTLAGKVLPGWSTNMRIVSQEGRWFCTFTHGRERLWGDRSAPNSGPDTCRAILSAILAALIAKEANHDR